MTDAVSEAKIMVNSEPMKKLEKNNMIESGKNIFKLIMKENSTPSVLCIIDD